MCYSMGAVPMNSRPCGVMAQRIYNFFGTLIYMYDSSSQLVLGNCGLLHFIAIDVNLRPR